MEWYYSQQGQQKGPVSTEQLDQLTRSGAVTAQTLVWREGLPNWTPYATVAQADGLSQGAASAVRGGASGDLVVCVECSRGFPKSETVSIEGSSVCAACKPIFMQKIREGIGTGAGTWRSHRRLVTSLDATLPNRCLKCNAPAEGKPIKRKLYWHPPAVYFALLANVLIYIIAAVITRKRGVVVVSICPSHRSARINVILISWLLALGGFAGIVVGIAQRSAWIGCVGGAAFLGGLILGLVRGRLIVARKITDEHMWLGGCGDEFLAGFPEWTGPP